MKKDLIILTIVMLLALCVIFFVPNAKSQVVVVVPSPYQQCVNSCLAYNGYNNDTYDYCETSCQYPPYQYDPAIIIGVGGYWLHGRFFHGHDYPRRDFHPRHDEPRNDHHGRR